MADGVVLDLYAEDLDKDFSTQNQVQYNVDVTFQILYANILLSFLFKYFF